MGSEGVKDERLTGISSIRADSPEVEEVFGSRRYEYREQYDRVLGEVAKYGVKVDGILSPEGKCALDMYEADWVRASYELPIDGADLVPVMFDRSTSPHMDFETEDEARASLARSKAAGTPSRVEGVNLFIIPEPLIDRSEGFGREVISASPDRVVVYALHPSVFSE